MPEPTIDAQGIRVSFSGVEVLKGIDLELLPGEVHAIVGENGAGKSTMAKVLAGVVHPTHGSVLLHGETVNFSTPADAIRAGIGLIHQEPLSFPDLTVAESLFVGFQPRKALGLDWAKMRSDARQILDSIGAKIDVDRTMDSLSVADRQLVDLASTLTHDASVLILDETTASLTPKETAELFVIVRRLRDQGKAIAFVSHHMEEIFEISDRITVLRDGQRIGTKLTKETNNADIVRMMVGRDVEISRQTTSIVRDRPAMVLNGFTPSGGQPVDLKLYPGEVLGIGGLVGAGRTELCEAIFGLSPSTGGLSLFGIPQKPFDSPGKAMKAGIGLVPEDRQHAGLMMAASLSDNATLAALREVVSGWWLRPSAEKTTTLEALAKLQTKFQTADQAVSELSGGNQQKVVLAKWMLTNPRVLILDEPTRGVDIGAKHQVHTLIRGLASEGLAILLISSDLPELLALSDRIAVMRERRIVAEFDGATATESDVIFAATGQEQKAA